jgi:N-acetylmuramoyl-L-alanine amidase
MSKIQTPPAAKVLALWAALSCAFPAVVAAVEVRDVRLWAGPESTRVVLDLSSTAEHQLFTLRDPERVVIDIAGGRLSRPAMAPAGQGVVKEIRTGAHEDGSLRVVLDLSERVQARSFLVEPNEAYGHRLVVDLAAARPETAVRADHAPAGDSRDLVIAIDAGHGGEDPGAIGRSGTFEKNVALAISRALARRVDREPGMKSLLVRDGDYFVTHRDRIQKARTRRADLFVSIHADAIKDRSVSGSSVYVLSARGASNEAARWLAERQNASDLIGGVSLSDKDDVLASVLLDLSQTASINASVTAAERVLHELDRVGQIRKPAVQHAGFLVLKSPDIPSILVETAYISNPGEERRLKDPRHQEKLASAIHSGIRAYFHANPPPGTRIAALLARQANAGSGPASLDSGGDAP